MEHTCVHTFPILNSQTVIGSPKAEWLVADIEVVRLARSPLRRKLGQCFTPGFH